MKAQFVCFVALALLCAATADAAHFRLKDTQPLCFVEDIGYGSEVVVGDFTRKRSDAVDHIPVKVTVTTPDHTTKKPVYSSTVRAGTTSFSFKPDPHEKVGMYPICFTVEQSGWTGNDNLYIEINLVFDHHDRVTILPKAEPDITRQKVHKNEEVFVFTDFDGLPKETLRTHEYIERATQMLAGIAYTTAEIKDEVKYFEERTQRMRYTSESTFDRVWMCAVVTILVLVVVSWVQFSFLKSFLKRKKLV